MRTKITYKSHASNPDYFVLYESGVLRVVQDQTTSDFAIGEFVEVSGRVKAGVLYADSIAPLAETNEPAAAREADAWLSSLIFVREPGALVDSPVIHALSGTFKNAAMMVQAAVAQLQPILVRFDDDADGITSALYLHALVEHCVHAKKLPYPKTFFRAFQSEAPIFEKKHLQHLEQEAADFAKKPLIVLLDHGGNPESVPALELAKKAGFSLLLVDHHPPDKRAIALFDLAVHPALAGGASAENTGLLMYHVANAAFDAPADWAFFAMQGDRSPYAKKEFFKEPVVLDYAALKNEPLKKYAALLADKNKVDLLYLRCQRLRENAVKDAEKKRRMARFGDVDVQWLDISYVDFDYPPRGGVVQGLHEKFENQGPLVTVGFDSERVIFRANAGAEQNGFAANAWIADLKKKPNVVGSGGGHARAASMRVKPGKSRLALDWLDARFRDVFGAETRSTG